jgi:hypothetical protein
MRYGGGIPASADLDRAHLLVENSVRYGVVNSASNSVSKRLPAIDP